MRCPWGRHQGPSEDAQVAVAQVERALEDTQRLAEHIEEVAVRAHEVARRADEVRERNHIAEAVWMSMRRAQHP